MISRRSLVAAGLATAAGALGLGVPARIADKYGLLPPDSGGLYGPGESLTFASQRLLNRHALAREFAPNQISTPFANGRPPKTEDFKIHQADGFRNWRLEIDGMVQHPATLSVSDVQRFPSRTQITGLACEEGWSFIAEWTGAPLAYVLDQVGVLPQAK